MGVSSLFCCCCNYRSEIIAYIYLFVLVFIEVYSLYSSDYIWFCFSSFKTTERKEKEREKRKRERQKGPYDNQRNCYVCMYVSVEWHTKRNV